MSIPVVGGGLAGSEAAWQLAERGRTVRLFEMRPAVRSPAHATGDFAELVCSNSFKSDDQTTATGLLKWELETLGSLVLRVARQHAIPAGTALAVDRSAFSRAVTSALENHPNVQVIRSEVTSVADLSTGSPALLATGPLTGERLFQSLGNVVGSARLSFFDAASPIVDAASLDESKLFRASRYGKGSGADYLNCRLDKSEYVAFREALVSAARVKRRDFEPDELFQACQPIEELARKGEDVMRFGPMKPVGLVDPATGERPYAVLQLRAENAARTAYNLVGCQTNLTFGEQRRVFGLVPALARADFLRFGVMHRNSYVDAPRALSPDLSLRAAPSIFLAGQLTGTEGYLEAAGTGLLAALNIAARLEDARPVILPTTTALGSLVAYATDPSTDPYQPMHVNFGLVPPLDKPVRGKRARYAAYADRAKNDLLEYARDPNALIGSEER